MSVIKDMSDELRSEWLAWVAARPANVRAVAERFWPNRLYRLKSTGHRVTLLSFGERTDGTVTLTVNVGGKYNFVAFERQVFGIDPDDLEECELPDADELTGSDGLSPEEAVAMMRSNKSKEPS